jgi:squalene-associated FAD-dependent desaturase
LSAGRGVVVIGGGLAGIAAALDCAGAGAPVTLVEVRPRLGGAAYSFEREGLEIDNGQHVFMRCCVAYRALLRRLGSEHSVSIQPRLRVPVLTPGSRKVVLRRRALPAPLHMAGALARYRHLSVAQRVGAARAARALSRLDLNDEELERLTFGAWLEGQGQGPDAVSVLWDVIVRPTLNFPAAQASLALGAFTFRTALLSKADAGDIGFHSATLSRTIGEPARRALSEAGVEVKLGWRAEGLEQVAGGFEIRGAGEGSVSAEVVIVAVPQNRAAALLQPLAPDLSRRLGSLGNSPIVNLHVVYDRPVCEEPFAAGVRTPVQYIFDRTAAAGAPAGCQYLAVSLSAAAREMEMSAERLRERYLPALEQLLPRARGATVERFLVTREHAATFRAAPGVGALRPGPRSAVAGLVLAGAWTDTGWPGTLESAVLSGHAAALQALRQLEIEPTGWSEPTRLARPATAAGTATP